MELEVMTKEDIGYFLKMQQNEVNYLLYKKKKVIEGVIVKKNKKEYWVNKKELLSSLGIKQ